MRPGRVQLLIHFGYDGARFWGLAQQPDRLTAALALRRRFDDAGVTAKALCFAARTDRGVHAQQNVATCWLVDPGPEVVDAVCRPRDDGLRQVRIERVPIHVHARASARGKHYRYRIRDGCVTEPPQLPDTWCVTPTLDDARMARAARHFVGSHDFSSFRSPRCRFSDPVRTLTRTDVFREPGGGIVIDIYGQSFLRRMMRIMTGTLAEVGAGFRAADDIAQILAARRRNQAGPTAPAHGLTLMGVEITLEGPPPKVRKRLKTGDKRE